MTQAQYLQYLGHKDKAWIEITFLLIPADMDHPDDDTEDLYKLSDYELGERINKFWEDNWPDSVSLGGTTVLAAHPENVTKQADRADRCTIKFEDIRIIYKGFDKKNDGVKIRFQATVNNLANLINNIDAWRLEGDKTSKIKVIHW
jgi:hypothetical protein